MSDLTPSEEEAIYDADVARQESVAEEAAAAFDELTVSIREFSAVFGCAAQNGDLRCGLMNGHRLPHVATWTVDALPTLPEPF